MFVNGRVSSRDSGKTMVDACLGEIMTTCEKIHWLLKEGERSLKTEYRQAMLFKCPKSALLYRKTLNVLLT